jgi:drug/metabolite transporter (DMT)-like permease
LQPKYLVMPYSRLLNVLLFVVICLIWGSSFILIKCGLYGTDSQPVLSAYQVAALRIFSAGLILLPIFISKAKQYSLKTWGYLLLSGLLVIFMPSFLFCIAETYLDSALTGTLNVMTPFFVVLFGITIFKDNVNWKQIAGLFIGLFGIVLLMTTHQNLNFSYWGYAAYVILATACYGLNACMVKHHLTNIPPVTIAALSFVPLMVPALLILYFTGYFAMPLGSHEVLRSTLASCTLGVIGSAAAWILFYILLKRSGPVLASSVSFIVPAVALGWGWFYGETITSTQVICLLIILFGVYWTNPVFKTAKSSIVEA